MVDSQISIINLSFSLVAMNVLQQSKSLLSAPLCTNSEISNKTSLIRRLLIYNFFIFSIQLGGSLYLNIMGGGTGLERDMEGCDVFNSHRLSQSLPGLNGSIPQTTEMVI